MRKLSSIVLAAAAAVTLAASPAFAEGDAAKGEKVYKKCQACHNATEEKNKVGPHLVGIVGRQAASVEGYKYGEGITAKAGEIDAWDEAELMEYLADPKAYVGKTKMAFKLGKEEDRADVVAYLKSLGN